MTPEAWERARSAWLRATALGVGEEERLRARLAPWTRDDEALRALAADHTGPDRLALARIRDRLRVRGTRRRRWGPALGVLAGGALAAAVALFLMWPAPVATNDVRLSFDGIGWVEGTERAPEVVWESGTVRVDVTPRRGIDLTVRTPEATIQVVGTAFEVTRSGFATHVAVQHGTVRVVCAGQEPLLVVGGAEHTCLPGDLEGWVGRALALRDPAARLSALDTALGLAGPAEAVTTELLAARVTALAEVGRSDEALESAVAVLQRPGAETRVELLAFVARERFAREGCAASDAVDTLLAVDPGAPEGLLAASCAVDTDPEDARARLAAARPRATGAWAEVATGLDTRLRAP